MKTAPAVYSELRFSTGKNIKIYQKKKEENQTGRPSNIPFDRRSVKYRMDTDRKPLI
jgi:hypothetical protein